MLDAAFAGVEDQRTVLDVVATVLVIAVLVTPSALCVAKGKPWLALLGVTGPFFPVIGMLRLAKPSSWWARRFYGDDRLAQARRRFGPTGPEAAAST